MCFTTAFLIMVTNKHDGIGFKNYCRLISQTFVTFDTVRFYTSIIIILLCSSSTALAQRQSAAPSVVSLRASSGSRIPFTLATQPKWTIQNGVLNIAITSKQGALLQVSELNTKLIHDTVVPFTTTHKLVLIKDSKTFTHRTADSSTIEISCDGMQPGNRITVYLNGYVWLNKERVTIRATLRGVLPKAQYTLTH